MVYEIDPSISTAEALRSDPALAKVADDEYAATQSGPRTRIGYSAAYLPFSHYMSPSEISTLVSKLPATSHSTARQRDQILAQRFSSPDGKAGQMEFLFEVSNYSPFYTSQPDKRYGTMMAMLQFPFSAGSIHIPPASFSGQPTTSDESPVIDPKFYAGPGGEIDFLSMVAAQKFGHKICSTPPLADMIVERVFPPAPMSTHAGTDSDEDEDFSAWVRDNTITSFHPVGTCAMGGSAGKADGVVDSRLRVYGVRGLRVVDASIMPLQISAHLQATVYAIGEKGASMIMEDWEAAKG
jgi:choline dehydrogenase-like flavoprotein